VEHGIKTGQLFVGSKFAGVASTARAYGGTGLPPCPAYDFSSALNGTFARTVEPEEKGTPPNFREPPAATGTNVETKFSVTNIWLPMINFFKICVLTKRFWPSGKVSTAHLKRNVQPSSRPLLDSVGALLRYAVHLCAKIIVASIRFPMRCHSVGCASQDRAIIVFDWRRE